MKATELKAIVDPVIADLYKKVGERGAVIVMLAAPEAGGHDAYYVNWDGPCLTAKGLREQGHEALQELIKFVKLPSHGTEDDRPILRRLEDEKIAYMSLAKSYEKLKVENQKWHGVMAMMERIIAAHPCKKEACSCRELAWRIEEASKKD